MPELQPSQPDAAMPAGLAPAAAFDDFDFALGCECADPALQIERWGQETAAAAADPN